MAYHRRMRLRHKDRGGGAAELTGTAAPIPTGAAEPAPPAPSTRSNATRLVAVSLLVLLGLVITFIVQNLQRVRVTFITAHWSWPLAVDLLLAAVLGGLVAATMGAARKLQHRRLARRQRRTGT